MGPDVTLCVSRKITECSIAGINIFKMYVLHDLQFSPYRLCAANQSSGEMNACFFVLQRYNQPNINKIDIILCVITDTGK